MSTKNINNECEITKTETTTTTGMPILKVPYGSENKNIAARNQLADFANRLGRRGTKIRFEPCSRWFEWRVWSDKLKPQEQETSGVRKITAFAAARIGWTFVELELTKECLDYIKAHDPSYLKHGYMDESGVVRYGGETPEEIISKMTQDNINIPRQRDFTPKGQLKMKTAREAVIQRLVDTGVISEFAARFYL
jgi:hypothetical protein